MHWLKTKHKMGELKLGERCNSHKLDLKYYIQPLTENFSNGAASNEEWRIKLSFALFFHFFSYCVPWEQFASFHKVHWCHSNISTWTRILRSNSCMNLAHWPPKYLDVFQLLYLSFLTYSLEVPGQNSLRSYVF